jgi:hypothetical protein
MYTVQKLYSAKLNIQMKELKDFFVLDHLEYL